MYNIMGCWNIKSAKNVVWPEYLPDTLKNRYKVVADLHRPGENNYLKIADVNNKFYFMKIIKMNKTRFKEIQAIELIKDGHPNIIKFVEAYECEDFCYVITPWYENDVFSAVEYNKLTEDNMKNIIRKMVDLLIFLLKKGILYTDFKGENIMVDDKNEPYLTDFDLFYWVAPNESKLTTGIYTCTKDYAAPETLIMTEYSEKTVSWTIGVLLYIMIEGGFPFDSDKFTDDIRNNSDATGMYKVYKNYMYPITYNRVKRSDNLENLVNGMLDVNPITRLSLEQIKVHPWLS